MTMPNFLVIGAMKAGTTALYYYLEQHPEIYMSPLKEPNFFAFEGETLAARLPGDPKGMNRAAVTEIEEYLSLFDRASDEKIIGDASHWYLFSTKAAERIRYHVPNAKMIAILRNPVDRAYSHFLHSIRNGTERVSDFAKALEEEENGERDQQEIKDYVSRGLYYNQLKRYYDTFHESQIRVYLYDDLASAPLGIIQDVFRFLEVDPTFVPDVSLRRNVSGLPKINALDRLLRNQHATKRFLVRHLPRSARWRLSKVLDGIKNRNLAEPPPLEAGVRRHLTTVYREDILNLQVLMGRDLSAWLNQPGGSDKSDECGKDTIQDIAS